jgi:hypothetical protein
MGDLSRGGNLPLFWLRAPAQKNITESNKSVFFIISYLLRETKLTDKGFNQILQAMNNMLFLTQP